MSEPQSSDKAAAFTGLIVTTVGIFVVMLATVLLTNMKFAGHAEADVPTVQEPATK